LYGHMVGKSGERVKQHFRLVSENCLTLTIRVTPC